MHLACLIAIKAQKAPRLGDPDGAQRQPSAGAGLGTVSVLTTPLLLFRGHRTRGNQRHHSSWNARRTTRGR